jgi:hypothetical protein
MYQDLRRDVRHLSSQKAVLLNKGGLGNLCVITNLSNRGLCLAVVGSSKPVKKDRLDLKVDRGTLLCNVVNAGREGLHCRFDDFIDEPSMSRIFKSYPAPTRADDIPAAVAWQQPTLLPHFTYDRSGRWNTPGGVMRQGAYGDNLTRIYSEGCFAGREQIDPVVEALDATVEVLNPYNSADEREHWALGFIDAVRHMNKHWFGRG